MKKEIFYSALAVCLMANTLFAQRSTNGIQKAIRLNVPVTTERFTPLAENDTLFGPAFSLACGANITSYGSQNGGLVGGVNGYGDREKAQRIFLGEGDNFTVQEVWGFFSSVHQIGGPATLRAKVYAIDAEGAPGTLLGTSSNVSVSDIDTSSTALVPTAFDFPTPIAVSGSEIFVSIDISGLYASQDTVGLWMTEDGCGSEDDAYELWEDGTTWATVSSGWTIETNFLIAAVVQFDPVSSVNSPVASVEGIALFAAAPNPGSDEIVIGYALDESTRLQIQLYSMDGQLLQTIDKGLLTPGEFKETLRVDRLPAGTYVYGLITEKGRLMNKLVVER